MAKRVRKTYDSAKQCWRVDVVEQVADNAALAYTFPLTEADADWLAGQLQTRLAQLVSPRTVSEHAHKGTMHEVVGRPERLYYGMP